MTDTPRTLAYHGTAGSLRRELDRARDVMVEHWVRYRAASLMDLHVPMKDARHDAWHAACVAASTTHVLAALLVAAPDEFGAKVADRLARLVDDLFDKGVPNVPDVPAQGVTPLDERCPHNPSKKETSR
jgi:hypothetical protein